MDLRKLKDKATEAFSKGKFAKAGEAYAEYCAADPKDLQARLRMGDAWAKCGQKEKAITAYSSAAEGFAKEGFLPRAIAASKLILELDPKHQGVQKMLADLYARKTAPAGNKRPTAVNQLSLKVDSKVETPGVAPGFEQRADAVDLETPASTASGRFVSPPAKAAPSPMTRADAIDLPPDAPGASMELETAGGVDLEVADAGPAPLTDTALELDVSVTGTAAPGSSEGVEIEGPIAGEELKAVETIELEVDLSLSAPRPPPPPPAASAQQVDSLDDGPEVAAAPPVAAVAAGSKSAPAPTVYSLDDEPELDAGPTSAPASTVYSLDDEPEVDAGPTSAPAPTVYSLDDEPQVAAVVPAVEKVVGSRPPALAQQVYSLDDEPEVVSLPPKSQVEDLDDEPKLPAEAGVRASALVAPTAKPVDGELGPEAKSKSLAVDLDEEALAAELGFPADPESSRPPSSAPPGLKPKRSAPPPVAPAAAEAVPPASSRIWLPSPLAPPEAAVPTPVASVASSSSAGAPTTSRGAPMTDLERSLAAFSTFDSDAPVVHRPVEPSAVVPAARPPSFTELELEGDSLLHAVETAAEVGLSQRGQATISAMGAEERLEAPDDSKAEPGALPRIPLFSDLPEDAFIALFERCPLRRCEVGEVVIQQGTLGDSFFVICSGRVRVFRAEGETRRDIATLEEGAFFGEMALLSGAARTASVEAAAEDTQMLEISAPILAELSHQYPTVAQALKKFCRQRMLTNVMNASSLFAPFSRQDRRALVEKFRARDVRKGEVLIKEGQRSDGMYIILSGEVEVRLRQTRVAALKEGDIFGEMSLLTKAPATATCLSSKHTSLLRLPREDFDHLILSHPQILVLVSELTDERNKQNAALASRVSGTGAGATPMV